MRLWQLASAVLLAAIVLSIGRDEVGRVALVVFIAGLAEVALGTAAILMLFRSLAALADARGPARLVEAVAATGLILVLSSASMIVVVCVAIWTVQQVVA